MTMLLNILGYLTDGFNFIKKHPKFFLGLIVALFIMLFFRQCETNRLLQNDIERLNVELDNEANRTINNVEALKDSIIKLDETNTYIKGVLRVKENETEILSTRLSKATKKVVELSEKIKNSEVKNVYITDITSDITTSDVLTHVEVEDSNTFSVGVQDSNDVYSIKTNTWFEIKPDGDMLRLDLLDRYGDGKSSLLDYKLNFTITTSQLELPNGNTRILIRPTDINGNEIPSDILRIPFADGVDFIDVQPKVIVPPSDSKRRRITAVIGPTGMITYGNGQFRPFLGVGITVGYRLW